MQRGLSSGLTCGLIMVAGLLLGGCQAPPKDTTAPPANEETVRLIRQSFTASDPKAVVGLVIAVLPDQMYAAVGDVDVKDFSEGEVLSFIDSNKKFLTNGTIKKVTSDALNIQYEVPGPGSRAPKVGDLAVRFKP
jgi:hypothetical protein